MKKIILLISFLVAASVTLSAQTKNYKVTVFGAKTDGVTDNTGTIQKAVDFISENGGGNLCFYVGRYVSGSIELKDNVHIVIAEGAVIVAPTNYYQYKGAEALFWAEGKKNVAVTGIPGKPGRGGVIETDVKALSKFVKAQEEKGHLAEGTALPAVFSFKDCDGVTVDDLKIIAPVTDLPYRFTNCSATKISGLYIYGEDAILTPEMNLVKLAK